MDRMDEIRADFLRIAAELNTVLLKHNLEDGTAPEVVLGHRAADFLAMACKPQDITHEDRLGVPHFTLWGVKFRRSTE